MTFKTGKIPLNSLEKYRDVIELCGKCGDCATDGTEQSTAKKNIDKPCAVKNVLGFEAYDARGRILVLKNVLNGRLGFSPSLLEWAYSCTTCGSCKETCLAIEGGIDTPSMMEAVRQDLVANDIKIEKHGSITRSIVENGNPYGEIRAKRKDILAGRELKPGTDVLLFIGCTATFRETQIASSTMDMLDKLGIDYNVLEHEGCCGSILKRLGYSDQFRENAVKNVDMITKSGAKRVIFPCAGCYRTFKQEYKPLDTFGVQYLHVTEFIDDWLSKHQKTFKFKHHARISYHDPCHLGRHAGVYEAPRSLLKRIENSTFIELNTNRNYSHCCGSGGGVKSSNPELAKMIAWNRNVDAVGKTIDILVSACPFCERNLKDGLQDGLSGKLKIVDITELLATTMEEKLLGEITGCTAGAGEKTTGVQYMEYLSGYPEIFSDLVEGSMMDFTLYENIDQMENGCDPVESFNVLRTADGIKIIPGRADNPDLQLALSVVAVQKLVACSTKSGYASLFGTFYNEPDEDEGWIDFVLNKRTKTLIRMGYGKFAEAAGILEDEDAV